MRALLRQQTGTCNRLGAWMARVNSAKVFPMLAVSIIALVISGLSVPFTAWAARATARQAKTVREQTEIQREQVAAAREQTQLQIQLSREAAQPYVWADIQPDMQQGTVLHVVVGNSGPTMAHNVRVTFDPPLPKDGDRVDTIASLEEALRDGLRSLAPGRVIRWSLGPGHKLLNDEASHLRKVVVSASGPYGALPTLEVEIDISEWRKARDAPDGSLHHVRGAVQDLAKVVEKVDGTLRRGIELLSSPTPEPLVELPADDDGAAT